MRVIIHLLLVLKIGRCTADPTFETKTADVGEDVTLTCNRENSWHLTYLIWIRLVSGTFPEILGGTLASDYEGVENNHHITAKQEPGTFVLKVSKAQLSDTAIYYCMKVKRQKMSFLKGIFLTIKGQESDVLDVTQVPSTDPVRPGDSVTLQCSVLSDSQDKFCREEHNVFWFRTKSDESRLSLVYADGNSNDQCERRPESRKCVYNFFKNVGPSDAGTYYCAVATCGQILFGNGTKLDVEVGSTCDSQKKNTFLFLLCVALAISLIVIVVLIYVIVKNSCCSAATNLQTNAGTSSVIQQSQQRAEESLVYYTPKFTKMKSGKAGRRNAAAKDETIYTDVRTLVTH